MVCPSRLLRDRLVESQLAAAHQVDSSETLVVSSLEWTDPGGDFSELLRGSFFFFFFFFPGNTRSWR